MNIKKIIKVLLVDAGGILVGILNGFLLPKFLSIESYAFIKTFALYISYSGMLHLGFSDGIYILLGGKELNEIKQEKIKGYLIVLIKIISLVFLFLIVLSIFFIRDAIFVCFILYAVPYQIILFATLLSRATGELDKYTSIKIYINSLNLISTLGVIILNISPYVYIATQIIGYLFYAILYTFQVLNKTNKTEKIQIDIIKYIIRVGFIVMIANTVNTLFFSLDRWFIKYKYDLNEFAYYSFAISMLNLFMTFISSITIMIYPFLAKNKGDEQFVRLVKKYIIIISIFSPSIYFILEFVINSFINQYISSLQILGVLILCIPFLALINILCSNLYKALNKGQLYLKTMLGILLISFIMNILAVIFFDQSITIAYATFLSLFIFYLIAGCQFNALRVEKRELIYFVVYFVSYIYISASTLHPVYKCISFTLIMTICSLVFYIKEVKVITRFLSFRKILNKLSR